MNLFIPLEPLEAPPPEPLEDPPLEPLEAPLSEYNRRDYKGTLVPLRDINTLHVLI
jgi:hypothetical protein